MSKNIVFEGWLTKSPPSKRIWRTKWRRRWFALRQSGELPGQYFLDYYADRNCRRLKGTINLDLCEQVDAGLHMERTGNGVLDPKLRGSVFTIQTQSRTYHLEADCEAEMEKWVDAICRVCGLRATDGSCEEMDPCQNIMHPISSGSSEQTADSAGPYIAISDCVTGSRAQDSQSAFTFDPMNIVTSTRTLERVTVHREHHIYTSQPQMKLHNIDFSENESNLSDEECKSLTSSQSNIGDFSVAKSFTKLSTKPENNEVAEEGDISVAKSSTKLSTKPENNEVSEEGDISVVKSSTKLSTKPENNEVSEEGPPVPPRPPKTFALRKDMFPANHPQDASMQYWNLSVPPAVDRALKPRTSSYSISSSSSPFSGTTVLQFMPQQEIRRHTLQYLDLDLKPPGSPSKRINKSQDSGRRVEISHGKFSSADADSAYKTVDFLKTEAFNITRQDAEAARSNY